MSRPQFETVVAQAPKEKLVRAVFTPTTHVQPGAEEETVFYSSPNTVARIVGLRVEFPERTDITSTGDHEVFISYDVPEIPENLNVMYGRSPLTEILGYSNGHWEYATASQKPADAGAQTAIVSNLEFDNEVGLRILYRNSASIAQTGKRIYIVTWVEREVR